MNWEQWLWRGTSHSTKLKDWSLTIRCSLVSYSGHSFGEEILTALQKCSWHIPQSQLTRQKKERVREGKIPGEKEREREGGNWAQNRQEERKWGSIPVQNRWLMGCVLWHFNPCRLFYTKSCLYIYIEYICFVNK